MATPVDKVNEITSIVQQLQSKHNELQQLHTLMDKAYADLKSLFASPFVRDVLPVAEQVAQVAFPQATPFLDLAKEVIPQVVSDFEAPAN